MNYLIRELKQDENKVLDTFLYEAIFIPEGVSAPPKDIINQPDLQVYVKDFGKNKGDLCLVAQVSDKIVGAVWVRIMNDYGHIDNETPSFAISLLKSGVFPWNTGACGEGYAGILSKECRRIQNS